MDGTRTSFLLYKMAEYNRELKTDYFLKSNLPNAKNMCSGEVDFASVFNSVSKKEHAKLPLSGGQVKDLLVKETEQVKITKSSRQASLDMASAQQTSILMLRLLNHSFKQDKLVLDTFKPAG